MKTIHLTVLGAILMLVFASPLTVQAAETADVVSDHQASAASYEQKAAEQDAVIAEHKKMMDDYERRFYINEKVTPKSGLHGDMDRHCNAIIQSAQQLKAELLGFAEWHKMRAAELQGQ